MVSVLLTWFRRKYIDFQLKMQYGKRVSDLRRRGAPPPPTCLSSSVSHGKSVYHGKGIMVLTMVSVLLTWFRGKYIDFQLKMLYGKRVSVLREGCPPPTHPTPTSICHFGSSRMQRYASIEIIPTIKTMIFWNQLHTTCDQIISNIS